MVGQIYEIKNAVVEQIEKDLREKGADRVDPQLVDIVKDLSEAEKNCMEAEYYSAVTEAMESRGYMPEGMGYSDGRSGSNRVGYSRRGYRDSMGRYARRGYHEDMDALRQKMNSASMEERETMKRELRQMIGE